MTGVEVRDRRHELHMSQEDLADAAGVSWRTIQAFERDESRPSRDVLVRIAEVLGLSSDDTGA